MNRLKSKYGLGSAIIAATLMAAPSGLLAGQGYVVTVDAGAHSRRSIDVDFQPPEDLSGKQFCLWDDRLPVSMPAQRTTDGRVVFRVDRIDARQRLRFILVDQPCGETRQPGFSLQRSTSDIALAFADQETLRYHSDKNVLPREDIKPVYARGGYISSLKTPGGQLVTDDYPPNHVHHHPIWFAWTKTTFDGRHPDFWNMGEATGTVVLDKVVKDWSGSLRSGLQARHRHVDLTSGKAVSVLDEDWHVEAHAPVRYKKTGNAGYWLLDLRSTLTVTSDKALRIEKYHYGGLGVRGRRDWNNKGTVMFETSEFCGRVAGNHSRPQWTDMSGPVQGKYSGPWAGLTVLDHPDNFRSPQPVRIHPKEPYFSVAPAVLGAFDLKPGQRYESRYRFVVHDGPLDRELSDRLRRDWVEPPTVTVRPQPRKGLRR